MNERLIEMRELAQQLAAELDRQSASRPRTFDAGLTAAQFAAAILSSAFAKEDFHLTPEVFTALIEIERILQSGQGKPELNQARDLFQRIRSPLMHGVYPVVTVANPSRYPAMNIEVPFQVKSSQPSRRARCAADLALRLLSPVHRQRYREEWAAELADLPRRDQVPYACRLVFRSWSLRRELSEKPSRAPAVGLVVMMVIPGVDTIAALCGLDWPAAVVGVGWTMGLGWVVSSKDRTQHLLTLIREIRGSRVPIQHQKRVR